MNDRKRIVNIFAILAIVVSATYLCIYITKKRSKSIMEIEEAVHQINMNQAKLCILKMDVETTIFHREKLFKYDLWPYEVWFKNTGEIDIIVDLTKAKMEWCEEFLRVMIPEPEIDAGTVNIRPKDLERVGCVRGLTFEWRQTEIDEEIRGTIIKDMDDLVRKNFPTPQARKQAVQALSRLYKGVDFKNIIVQFQPTKDIH